jgi:hypothetical protein
MLKNIRTASNSKASLELESELFLGFRKQSTEHLVLQVTSLDDKSASLFPDVNREAARRNIRRLVVVAAATSPRASATSIRANLSRGRR